MSVDLLSPYFEGKNRYCPTVGLIRRKGMVQIKDGTNDVDCQTCGKRTTLTTDGHGRIVGYDNGKRHPCEVI